MHHFKLLPAIAVLLLQVSFASAQQQKYSPATEEKIKAGENNLSGNLHLQDSTNYFNLASQMALYNVNGISITVVQDYKIAWAKGYGLADTSTGKPVTEKTLFQVASISKSLNALGLLKLVQQGNIDLNTDINQYLRSWTFQYDSVAKGKKITLANLLSHTAGLSVHGFGGYNRGDTIPTLPQILDGLPPANSPAVRSQFEPGLRFKYSGGGTTISQLMLQDVTGRPYAEYMYKEVLQPLGMTMSSYAQPPLPQSRPYLATGYGFSGQPVDSNYHIYPEQAAAGLWSNAEDMARYIIATQRSLEGGPSAVLDTGFTRLRLTPYIDSNAALGVFISNKGGRAYFGHNGSNAGFQSVYTGSMQGGDGVVVFVNSDNGRILQEIVNSVAKVYGWAGFHQPEVRKLVPLSPAMINTYTGNYLVEADSIRIYQNAGELILSINNQQHFKMYFTAPGSFLTKELPMRFEFDKDAGGSVTGFHFEQNGKKMPVKKLD